MVEENIIVRIRANVEEFNRAMGMSVQNVKRMSQANVTARSTGARLALGVRRLTHGMRGFRMEMLGVMFFGQNLSRFFSGLLRPALQLTGTMDLLSKTLGIGLLPTGLMLNQVMLNLMEKFLNLSEPVRNFIGLSVVALAVLLKLLFAIGMFALGISSFIQVFGAASLSVALFAGGVIAVIGIIIGLVALWAKWEKVSVGVKIALAAIAIVLGVLLIWLGFIPAAVISIATAFAIIGMAIAKNWRNMVDFLQTKYHNFLKWFESTSLGKLFNIDIGTIKEEWQKLIDFMKETLLTVLFTFPFGLGARFAAKETLARGEGDVTVNVSQTVNASSNVDASIISDTLLDEIVAKVDKLRR